MEIPKNENVQHQPEVEVIVETEPKEKDKKIISKSFLEHVKSKSGNAMFFLDVFVILHIAMVVIGALYLNKCPRERYIPIYLIVGGVFGLVRNLLDFYALYLRKKGEKTVFIHDRLANLLHIFAFCWFVAGCVWVYRIFRPDYDNPDSPLYCNKVLYLFTFWKLNCMFMLIILSCCVICLLMMCIGFHPDLE